jgi:putative phosphoesterase
VSRYRDTHEARLVGATGELMRYALISDIHANLPALRAVLNDIAKRDIDAIYHLGDLTGYAPWPNETVELLRERGIPGIAGNYDSTVATGYKHCGCQSENPEQEKLSHISYEWTRGRVSAETKEFLASLPFRIDIRPLGGHVSGPTITLVHGNQTLNTVYVTQDRTDEFLSKMASDLGARESDAICFGHTHKPWHRVVNGINFINTGSVGRPKDGDWRPCYTILTAGETQLKVDFRRVGYEIDEAVRGINAAGLPEEFGDQLRGTSPD